MQRPSSTAVSTVNITSPPPGSKDAVPLGDLHVAFGTAIVRVLDDVVHDKVRLSTAFIAYTQVDTSKWQRNLAHDMGLTSAINEPASDSSLALILRLLHACLQLRSQAFVMQVTIVRLGPGTLTKLGLRALLTACGKSTKVQVVELCGHDLSHPSFFESVVQLVQVRVRAMGVMCARQEPSVAQMCFR